MVVRPLTPEDAAAYVAIRREALGDAPLAFAASLEDDAALDPILVRRRLEEAGDSRIFGAFEGEMIGVAGAYRERVIKGAHKVHLWGMYVRSAARGSGAGAALRLYERHGFRAWGVEPEGIRHGGRSVAVRHRVHDLRGAADGGRSR